MMRNLTRCMVLTAILTLSTLQSDICQATVTLTLPANGATLVPIDVEFKWTGQSNCVLELRAFDADFSESGTNTFAEVQSPFAIPTPLNFETTYYWRVNGGDAWSFTTEPEIPYILSDPNSQTVEIGQTAVFTLDARNTTTFQWYKNYNPLMGEITETLTIANVQLSDEGQYSCEISNHGMTGHSKRASLWTKRLMSHWDFDRDLIDNVNGWDGVLTDPFPPNPRPIPVYDSNSISGQSLKFNGDGFFVNILGSEDWFNFHPHGFTVSAWINSTDLAASWAAIASKQDFADVNTGWMLGYAPFSGALRMWGADEDLIGDTPISDDKWHMVTGVYDGATMRLYIDGELEQESGPLNPAELTVNRKPLLFGAVDLNGSNSWNGLLDELKIWSYPLTAYDIAYLYTDLKPGESICLEKIAFDYNNNCIVDMPDFAIFASHWLDCNLIPDCI